MARPIIDDVVKDRIIATGIGGEFLQSLEYDGAVSTKMQRVSLKSSEFGLQPEPICKSLQNKFEAIGPKIGTCALKLETEDGPMSKELTPAQLRMLKALVMEQVNECAEYSKAVCRVFWSYVMFLLTGDPHWAEPKGTESKLELVVKEEFSKFILQNT